jgi:tetratricopeptide (TPR) repeat protein
MDRIEKLQHFLLQNPADSFLQHALALEYIKLQQDEKALVLFESIIAQQPDYIGTYYHLGKLLLRLHFAQKAIDTFEKGMVIAKTLKDNHAYNELQAALEDAQDE